MFSDELDYIYNMRSVRVGIAESRRFWIEIII
jgi:hypothetical protein